MYTRISDNIVMIDGIEYRKRKRMPPEIQKAKRKAYMQQYRQAQKKKIELLQTMAEKLNDFT